VQESIINDETGLLVERDSRKFSEAILRLLGDPNLASTFSLNGREHVARNWTWVQSTKSLESYLASCAKMW
jgi:glycosyltransferase involved in cell wall biosynthesis